MPTRISEKGGIEKTLDIVSNIHNGKFPGVERLMWINLVSQAGLFRHLKTAKRILKMSIRFDKDESGYYIEDYGILDKNKL